MKFPTQVNSFQSGISLFFREIPFYFLFIFTVSCTFNVLIYFLWWRFYILTLPLFQGMAIPCHKPFYDTKDGDGRLSENPSSGHRCRYSLLKITPPRFSVILLWHFYRDLPAGFHHFSRHSVKPFSEGRVLLAPNPKVAPCYRKLEIQ